MNLPFSRLDISTFLSPILDWTVAIVRLAIIPEREREVAPLMSCVETMVWVWVMENRLCGWRWKDLFPRKQVFEVDDVVDGDW
jgi:hypothetical protein